MPEKPQKCRVFERAVTEAGLPAPEYPSLGIAWGSGAPPPEPLTNAAGVTQLASRGQGDAFVGCEDGSKTTLDLTYVPLALAAGAELRPLCEALAIQRAEPGYCIRYLDHRTGRTEQAAAPRVILAAGGLNTQRLLFRARAEAPGLPDLPATLGRRFSPNGDFLGLLWRTAVLEDSSRGPSFGVFTRMARTAAAEEAGAAARLRFVLGEVGIPVQARSPGIAPSLTIAALAERQASLIG